MLTENIYVNKDGLNLTKILESWSFAYLCKKCNSMQEVNQSNIEDCTDSDPHDPLQDYLICSDCGNAVGLFNGVEGSCKGKIARLWADGSYIYLSKQGMEDERVV